MHFWNTNKLVEEFATKSLSERDKLGYYIFTLVAFTIGMELPAWFPDEEPYSRYDFAGFSIILLATVLGNWMVFKANRDHSDFIARAVCLSVPIVLRLMVATFLLIFPVYFTLDRLGWISEKGFSMQEQIAILSLGILFDFSYYLLLFKAIKRVNDIAGMRDG